MNTGFIIIPEGISDIDEYIQSCYEKLRVAILTSEDGSYCNECIITQEAISNVIFPNAIGRLGTAIIYLDGGENRQPIVIGTTTKGSELGHLKAGNNSILKVWDGCNALVNVDAANKTINIAVQSLDPSKIFIKTLGSSDSVITVASAGKVEIQASKNVEIQSCKEMLLTSLDLSKTENNVSQVKLGDTIEVTTRSTMSVNEGSEPAVLGQQLNDTLDKINEYIMTIKTAISVGASSVKPSDGGASAFAAMTQQVMKIQSLDFKNILSKVLFTD